MDLTKTDKDILKELCDLHNNNANEIIRLSTVTRLVGEKINIFLKKTYNNIRDIHYFDDGFRVDTSKKFTMDELTEICELCNVNLYQLKNKSYFFQFNLIGKFSNIFTNLNPYMDFKEDVELLTKIMVKK